METPELDKDIDDLKHFIRIFPNESPEAKIRLSEFQAIKARLDNLETLIKEAGTRANIPPSFIVNLLNELK